MIARSLINDVLSDDVGGTNHLTKKTLEALHYLLSLLNGLACLLAHTFLLAHLKFKAEIFQLIAFLVIRKDVIKIRFFIKAIDDLAGKAIVFSLNEVCPLKPSDYQADLIINQLLATSRLVDVANE